MPTCSTTGKPPSSKRWWRSTSRPPSRWGLARCRAFRNCRCPRRRCATRWALLEREGYLVQPHTSAGRIPTDKGYRFFVDTPSPSRDTGAGAVAAGPGVFRHRPRGAGDGCWPTPAGFCPGLTDYAAVVVRQAATRPGSAPCSWWAWRPGWWWSWRCLASGAVDKHTLELADDPSETQVATASAHLAVAPGRGDLGGHPVPVPSTDDPGRGPDRKPPDAALSHSGGKTWTANSQVYVGGAARMATAFDAVGTIRQVLDILEQQYVLVTLIRDVLDRGLSVAIGDRARRPAPGRLLDRRRPLRDRRASGPAPSASWARPGCTTSRPWPRWPSSAGGWAGAQRRVRGRVGSGDCGRHRRLLRASGRFPPSDRRGDQARLPPAGPASCTPTPTRATTGPRSSSSRSTWPTRPSAIPKRRRQYDMFGPAGVRGAGASRRGSLRRIRRRRAGRPLRRLFRGGRRTRRRRCGRRQKRSSQGRGRRGRL